MVGLASGLVAYELGTIGLANGLGLNTATLQTNSNTVTDPAANGFRWHRGPGGFLGGPGSMVFGASSQVSNVSVTGFNVSGPNQLTVTLTYTGTGTSPSVTVVGLSRGVSNGTLQTLSGSTIERSGWTSPTTVTLNMAGTGSLTNARGIGVLIVPYTGA